jgi:hypothetical protein
MLLFYDKQKTMTKKQKIIQLLQKEENQELSKFFLQKTNSMTNQNMQDLYFLLTSKDKNKIFQYAKQKSSELQQQSSELERIGIQAKSLTQQYMETEERKEEDNIAENLLHNL